MIILTICYNKKNILKGNKLLWSHVQREDFFPCANWLVDWGAFLAWLQICGLAWPLWSKCRFVIFVEGDSYLSFPGYSCKILPVKARDIDLLWPCFSCSRHQGYFICFTLTLNFILWQLGSPFPVPCADIWSGGNSSLCV